RCDLPDSKVRQAVKGDSEYPKKLMNTPVRLCCNNLEFTKDGYVRKNSSKACKTGRIALPDPVENLFILCKTKCQTETRPRKFLDLPGSNYTRSLQGLSIRSGAEEEHDMAAGAGDEDHEGDESDTKAEGEAADSQTVDGEPETTPEESVKSDQTMTWFAWSPSEMFWAEMYNLYGVRRPATWKIIDFTPGPGLAALQAARQCVPYVAFCLPGQSDTLRQSLTFQIMVEIVRGVNNGFTRRAISRVRSLTGGHAEEARLDAARAAASLDASVMPDSPGPQTSGGCQTTGGKRKRAEGSDSESSSSSSDKE
ncbi:ygeX, partial [Symbiodinium natans]